MNDREIRDLLDDAVADVEPRGGLDAIRSRTAAPSRRRARGWAVGAAVLATAATVATVTVLSQGPSTAPDLDPGFTGRTTGASASPSVEPSERTLFPVYFVAADAGGRQRLQRDWQLADGPPRVATLQAAVAGDTRNARYRSDWPSRTTVEAVHVDEDRRGVPVQVDLSGPALADRPADLTRDQAREAVQQLVWTLGDTVDWGGSVTFLIDGRPTATILGQPATGVVPDPLALADVQVDEPVDGQVLGTTFTVRGEASAFEGNVQWALTRDGRTVRHGFTTAAECCTLAPYSFRVRGVPAGDYTLVVRSEDPSGGEGTGAWEDTREITVR